MAKVFEAMYHGRCAVCDDEINEGDEVTYDDDELVHVECASVPDLTIIHRRSIVDPGPRAVHHRPTTEGPGNPPQTFF